MDISSLESIFRAYFEIERPIYGAEDPIRFRNQMLRTDYVQVSVKTSDTSFKGCSDLAYVTQFVSFLSAWSSQETHPLVELPPAIDGVIEDSSTCDYLARIPKQEVYDFLQNLVETQDVERQFDLIETFLVQIQGARGILTCLGFRTTRGSRNICPLTKKQCIDAFLKLHTTKQKLTVGARAFSKHCQRSQNGWWGSNRGNDEAKNERALFKLYTILDHAVWKNIHSLPHALTTMEIRNELGYGVRWYIEDQSFRGFLEPQMENGHEVKWRH